ncbi:hypothetical protein M9Y10_018960 [Tritrichomonas musculus]|uniref:Protein kinase domain-containing protein n=1 Tax=Tritrichomonas musculus TaxID=1915356 RepID=A0ABR2HI74_9EUKA
MEDFIDLSNFSNQTYIGKGSFAKVYKVEDKETGEIFAAKISLNKLTEEQKQLMTNLKREIGIMSQLEHPSILKFKGYSPIDFKNESYPVIITEYSSNGSLDNILKLERQSRSPPNWDDTRKLITLYGIASAMSYLHLHNIIHRDLKPENILEDDFLFPKVGDFGLSKTIHSNIDSMSTQSAFGLKGSPLYVPPECWEDNKYSKAGDVYAFAIIAYELLTLETPFKDYTIPMLCRRVTINGERPQFNCPIPDCYKDLIIRCWSQEPEKRPTFEEIKEELRSNPEFIIESIDKEKFLDYVEMIDDSCQSFDPFKKFQKVMLPKLSEIETKTSEEKEISDEKETSNDKESRKIKIERKEVEHHKSHSMFGPSSKNHTHFKIFHITRTEQRTVSTDVDGNKKYSEWTIVPGTESKHEVRNGMEGGFTEGYEKIVGNESKEIENRQIKIEKKEVEHHKSHSMFGPSSKNHTHFKIFHITRTEQRTVSTDVDGNKKYSEWTIVPGTESKHEVRNGMEGGFTEGYENEI